MAAMQLWSRIQCDAIDGSALSIRSMSRVGLHCSGTYTNMPRAGVDRAQQVLHCELRRHAQRGGVHMREGAGRRRGHPYSMREGWHPAIRALLVATYAAKLHFASAASC